MSCLTQNRQQRLIDKHWTGASIGLDRKKEIVLAWSRGVYRGEVDATCVQIGLRGEENYTLKGEEFPQIYGSYVIYKSFFLHGSVRLCLAAVLKQKCTRMQQILFQFPFSGVTPRTPATGGSAPYPQGGRGCEGREGKGRERGKGMGCGKFASLPLAW